MLSQAIIVIQNKQAAIWNFTLTSSINNLNRSRNICTCTAFQGFRQIYHMVMQIHMHLYLEVAVIKIEEKE